MIYNRSLKLTMPSSGATAIAFDSMRASGNAVMCGQIVQWNARDKTDQPVLHDAETQKAFQQHDYAAK
jgi:hypothetical protein